MPLWNRRDVLRTGLSAAIGASVLPSAEVARAISGTPDRMGPPLSDAPSHDAPAALRQRWRLDLDWRFHLGDPDGVGPAFGFGHGNAYAKAGTLFAPSKPEFDTAAWQRVDLPHDWAVDLPFVDDPALLDWGFKPVGPGYPATSVGWYRKTFDLPAAADGRRLAIAFDGVFRDCTVALNGNLLGQNLGGYVPFRFDITDVATYGGRNVLVVFVDARQHEGWWYEGAGIYRHVWLEQTAPVHVAPSGAFVVSALHPDGTATLTITTEIANDAAQTASGTVSQRVLDASGTAVLTLPASRADVAAWSGTTVTQTARVPRPALWSPESPTLYTLETTVTVNGAPSDQVETTFGIRSVYFDAERGFLLNGRRVEIKGTCNHQDHAGVGVAVPDALHTWRVEQLIAMGANAWRTAHNPPAPALLDACDRLGVLVLDETRMFNASDVGLSQLERMVRRDRNHPCVIAWSIGNEEGEVQGTDRGARIATTMRRHVLALDPSRPITAAVDNPEAWGRGSSTVVNVQGLNYRLAPTDAFHAAHPRTPMLGTEVASTVSTRGVYTDDPVRGYVDSYDRAHAGLFWTSSAESWWSLYAARPWLAGGFVWTGFDYRGEPTPSKWPTVVSHFGVLDLCGFPKDNYWYYRAWWTEAPVLHLFPHWNWVGREGQPIEVWCHTNCDRVELWLNGRRVGEQLVKRNSHAAFTVPYAPGRLEARGYRNGRRVLTAVRETTGAPARLVLHCDRTTLAANGEDVAVVTVAVQDATGRVVPRADDLVTFALRGSGRLLGVGNGDPSSHASERGPERRAFMGLAAAIVQSTTTPGELRVDATAPGLASASLTLRCAPAPVRPVA